MRMGGGLVLVMVIVALRDRVLGWNFSSLNTTTEDVTVLHVSVYYMRAYVSIKSEDRVPTLVESMWPESLLSSPVQVYAGKRFHHLSTRPSSCCRRLVQSYRTAVDPRGNLWIVDNGSEESGCRPKLLVMSFFNQEVQRKQLTAYSSNSITDLILDMRPILGIRSNTTRAYLSVRNKDYILAYSLTHNEVRRLKIQPSHVDLFSQPDPMSITAMAMLTLGTGREVALLYDNIEKALYYVDLRIGRSQGQLYATQLGGEDAWHSSGSQWTDVLSHRPRWRPVPVEYQEQVVRREPRGAAFSDGHRSTGSDWDTRGHLPGQREAH